MGISSQKYYSFSHLSSYVLHIPAFHDSSLCNVAHVASVVCKFSKNFTYQMKSHV